MISPSARQQLQRLADRRQEINVLLADPETAAEHSRFRAFAIELSGIEPVVEMFDRHQALEQELEQTRPLLADADAAVRALAREELPGLEARLADCAARLRVLLLPKDANDERNIFLEIRAGTGGDEAALFAGELFRMYHSYAESRGWQVEVMSRSAGEHGGCREIIARIAGQGAYSRLKFESGAHLSLIHI